MFGLLCHGLSFFLSPGVLTSKIPTGNLEVSAHGTEMRWSNRWMACWLKYCATNIVVESIRQRRPSRCCTNRLDFAAVRASPALIGRPADLPHGDFLLCHKKNHFCPCTSVFQLVSSACVVAALRHAGSSSYCLPPLSALIRGRGFSLSALSERIPAKTIKSSPDINFELQDNFWCPV